MFWNSLLFACIIYLKRGQEWLHFALFLVIVCAFFNIGFLHEIQASSVKEGALWVALLLASLLTTGDIFRQDASDGTMQQIARYSMGLEQWVLAKLLGQWLIYGGVFLMVKPILYMLLQIEEGTATTQSFLLGYWIILHICVFASCLTLANQTARYLLPVIILPLVLPVLVFGSGQSSTISQAADNADVFMLGIAILLSPLCVFASGAVLRFTTS